MLSFRHVRCAVLLLAAVGAAPAPPALGAEPVWRAGVAAGAITPAEPIWMAGYASRDRPSEGTVHDLHARALALEDADGSRLVIVSVEVLGLTAAFADRVAARVEASFGLPADRLLLASTHTHTGPVLAHGLAGSYQLDEEQVRRVAAYTRRLEDALVDVAGRALDDLQPALIGFGRTRAEFGVNRRVPTEQGITFGANYDGPVDPEVPVLRVAAPDGRLRALVFGYACHNTTLTGSFYRIAGDYAGFAQAALERAHARVTALFLMGCGADIDPQPRGALEHAEAHGLALAHLVAGALEGPVVSVRGRLRVAAATVRLPLRVPSKEELEARRTDANAARRRHAERMIARLDAGDGQGEGEQAGGLQADVPYRIRLVGLGDDLTLVTLPGEVVVDYALRLKRELSGRVWPVAYAHHVPAYIPSERVLAEGGYEADFSMVYYDLPGPFLPGLEQTIVDTVHRLAREIEEAGPRAGGVR